MYKTHGEGTYTPYPKVITESSVKIFHPNKVSIGEGTYIGHNTILKGYPYNTATASIQIGKGCWIGENCYLHGAAYIVMKDRVGIGPGTYLLTSYHVSEGHGPVIENKLFFDGIFIDDGANIEAKVMICAGVNIGKGAIVRAGSVLTHDVQDYSVVQGNPAKHIKFREPQNGESPL